MAKQMWKRDKGMKSVNKTKKIPLALLLLAMLALSTVATSPVYGLTGAIWTTDKDGVPVNQNIYDNKDDVYISGGPGPNGAKLPDGDYYFQVTDPSGSTLLSQDVISSRQFTVTGGVIVSAVNHATRPKLDEPGTVVVQLIPYADTPNPAGVYKVWVTRQEDYQAGQGNHGFIPSECKTDNFKIRMESIPTATICGVKYYDADVDGTKDSTEVGIEGWKIQLLKYGEEGWIPVETATTSPYGDYSFTVNQGGLYKVLELMPLGWWVQTAPTPLGEYLVEVALGNTYTDKDFGNVCLEAGHGGLTLGFWSNKNGQALITAPDIVYLNTLSLYKPAGWLYPPFTTKAQISTYLLSANAVDMRWMLSAQLIAANLNVLHGFLNDSTIVYVGPSTYVPSGFITVGQIISNAISALGLPHPANRAEQEYWKNLLDGLNNNWLPFVCPAPCLPIEYP
jgi:hypothetical protein